MLSAYQRVDRSRKRKTGNAGLGVATACRIVEAHGATLDESGARAGGGAEATVARPRVPT